MDLDCYVMTVRPEMNFRYAWARPPAGPRQTLEIDDFTPPRHS